MGHRRASVRAGTAAVPSGAADGLQGTVAVLVHDVTDAYFTEITSGVRGIAAAHGFLLLVVPTERDPDTVVRSVAAVRRRGVDVLILAGSGFTSSGYRTAMVEQITDYRSAGGRVVAIGHHGLPCPTVRPDNELGGQAIARHLLALGHRRIGVVTGPPALCTVADRFRGLSAALADAAVPLPPERIAVGDFARAAGHVAAASLLDASPELTAIVALNDAMALGVLAELRSRGVPVPQQVSVTGFDDIAELSVAAQPLTTVHVPMAQLGARAMQLALADGPNGDRSEVLSVHVVARGSTGPAPP